MHQTTATSRRALRFDTSRGSARAAVVMVVAAAALAVVAFLVAGSSSPPGGPDSARPDARYRDTGSEPGALAGGGRSDLADAGAPRRVHAASDHDPAAPARPPSCRVTGRVVDERGAPVPHAVVLVDGDADLFADVDADGRFELAVPPGAHRLVARAANHGAARADVDAVEGGDDAPGPTFVLGEGGVIAGRVFEDDGTPVVDVWVEATAEVGPVTEFFDRGGETIRIGTSVARTDANGAFRLIGLDPGTPHTVACDLSDRRFLKATPEKARGVTPGELALSFRVNALRALQGRVVDDETGAPIAHFRVAGTQFYKRDGTFEVAIRQRGTVRVEALGYHPQDRDDLDLKEDETRRGVELRMRPDPATGSVELRAHADSGAPVTAYTVFTSEDPSSRWVRNVDDREGSTTISGLPAGRYEFTLRARGHLDATRIVDVAAAETATVAATLTPAAAVRVRVRDSDGGIWTGDLAVARADGSGPKWRFVFDDDVVERTGAREQLAYESAAAARITLAGPATGRIENLAPGRYTLAVHFGHGVRRYPFEVFPVAEAAVSVVEDR